MDLGVETAQRYGAKPPCGFRSKTKREPKRTKRGANLTKILDSMVGFSDGLGGQSQPYARFLHKAIMTQR